MRTSTSPSEATVTWFKSSYSNGTGGNCVEVADSHGPVAVRDSKDPNGPVLTFSRQAWDAFVAAVRGGGLR
ncbi:MULTISPECIES: DUF397 domain-containing protein [Streptomycetaceae]|uniref:DUF397 domain-containing protein n=1 Tax=Streptantibioticus cattleyicolor (strain ATCC 35852 / DSM 46488 / JCM 4925 / NBRC 14057 / NRRL 8057) TaxID=1003195 RepID=F8JWG9_STREN|nr:MULTISPECIES: DUF397 domain-containing protein [Streptomycetaceae]AEW95749.1 hypothetical protein SCATT_33780 [Streptantibioticus cattleyicolor NRRL 8057 = DSM 46488]MYS60294.1 DUF397 domain-containing protein [Streptomyces sp. SID5468]CCB76089.1 conserved protein of unknown function [Streptantibioticus cattleyicolor NRRL 8057 = DSM 46488]